MLNNINKYQIKIYKKSEELFCPDSGNSLGFLETKINKMPITNKCVKRNDNTFELFDYNNNSKHIFIEILSEKKEV